MGGTAALEFSETTEVEDIQLTWSNSTDQASVVNIKERLCTVARTPLGMSVKELDPSLTVNQHALRQEHPYK
jgi:hypothetical protein